MWKKILLILGLITMLIAPVNAQSVGLGPQVGYYKAQDTDGNFMGGVAWRFKFTPMFGLKASINYRQEKYANQDMTVRSWPIMVTGLIYPLPIAYGAIGAGWYNTTFDYNQEKYSFLKDETKQEFGWHFGGGVELPVGTNFKLAGDIRYVFLDYNFEEIPGSSDVKSNFFVIMAGLLYNL
ncbi:porin family protein [candidate division KSB1 bacterium]|nr:porin family protein [candidate division KSB1 bacterium]